jgi:hypothetical protein
MKVVSLSTKGIIPSCPLKADHPNRGAYWRFVHGENGRGRKFVFIPLGQKDFPGGGDTPSKNQEYHLMSVSEGKAYILVNGTNDGEFLVLWDLSPGYRGGASYKIEGKCKIIAEGYEAQGDAGRMGGAPCPIVHVTGPCRLTWHRSGRLYGDPPDWQAVFDGTNWTVIPMDEQSCAVEAAFDA